MTRNLAKNKEWLLMVKLKDLSPLLLFFTYKEVFVKLLGVYFYSNSRNWDMQIDSRLRKAGRRMHTLRVCKKYGYSLRLFTPSLPWPDYMAFHNGVKYFYPPSASKFYCQLLFLNSISIKTYRSCLCY